MSRRFKRRRWAAVVRAIVGSVITVIAVIVQQLTGSRWFSTSLFATSTRPSILVDINNEVNDSTKKNLRFSPLVCLESRMCVVRLWRRWDLQRFLRVVVTEMEWSSRSLHSPYTLYSSIPRLICSGVYAAMSSEIPDSIFLFLWRFNEKEIWMRIIFVRKFDKSLTI